jgi:energy-coupling factor transporter ATP-binding protein EcfA2
MEPITTIKSSDRVFIAGKTGSGKTFLARHLTRKLPRLVVLDGKGSLSDWNLIPWDGNTRRALIAGEPVRSRVTAPLKGDVKEFWETVLGLCYFAGDLTIYIDEVYAITPPNTNPGPNLWACYTRGREFGVGVWSSTQRPVWIPLISMSEAEHYFCFRLNLGEDRKRLSAFMGEPVLTPIPDEHGFYYSRAEWDKPIYKTKLTPGETIPVEINKPAPNPNRPELDRINRRRTI